MNPFHLFQTPLEWISLFLAVLGTVIWSVWALRHPRIWFVSVIPATYFLDIACYYVSVFLTISLGNLVASRDFYYDWSVLTQIHAISAFIALILVVETVCIKWKRPL